MIHTSMFQKHIHKVKFYPGADDFTQALLVTNIMSGDGDDDVHPHHDYKAQVFADQQLLTESRQMIGNWSCSQQSLLTA